jgi:hypothetical protein
MPSGAILKMISATTCCGNITSKRRIRNELIWRFWEAGKENLLINTQLQLCVAVVMNTRNCFNDFTRQTTAEAVTHQSRFFTRLQQLKPDVKETCDSSGATRFLQPLLSRVRFSFQNENRVG